MRKEIRLCQGQKAICFLLLILSGVLLLLIFSSGFLSPVQAVTDAQIKTAQEELKNIQSKIDYYEKQLNNTSTELEAVIAKKAALDQMLTLYAAKLEKSTKLVDQYAEQIAVQKQEISDSETNSAQIYERFLRWIRMIYENGSTNYLEMILSAQSFPEFISSAEQISQLLTYETRMMESLSSELSGLRSKQQELEVIYTAQKKLQDDLARETKNYQVQCDKAASYIDSLEAYKETREAVLQKYEKMDRELNESLESMLKQWEEQRKNSYVGGVLMWPLDLGWNYISSGYRVRTDPISGKTNVMHYGIDIPAAGNSPIYAANSGTVVTAVFHNSYGNYVILDHGGGMMTLYAHMSKYSVQPGQVVKRGDVIGYVGTTGYSTGNHLHFEVRQSGCPVDPLGFVSAK